MPFAIPDSIEQEVILDFATEFEEAYRFCETKLVELEKTPEDDELINQIFRSVHTIKGNFSFVGLGQLVPLLQSVEDVLARVRNHDFLFDSSISDLVLLSMDRTHMVVEEIQGRGQADFDAAFIIQASELISQCADTDTDRRQKALTKAILLLDPSTAIEEKPVVKIPTQEASKLSQRLQKLLQGYQLELNHDLEFFINLMGPIESRSGYWAGRSLRILLLALEMNRSEGQPVDQKQLTAAVLMHDISMAFLPIELLHKAGACSQAEKELIQQHATSCHELLRNMQHWQEASQIVLQHHEKMDGSGYPSKLMETQICDGAKILAIADAYDAMTHTRAHATQTNRPFIRAILEINSQTDTHFSARWVECFNKIVKKLHGNGLL